MTRWQHRQRLNERGSILSVTAIGMLSFLLIAGLAIDISHMYVNGSELQNAADAAALAGASALNSNTGGITEAVNRAIVTMNNYQMDKTGVTLSRSDVRFAVNLSDFDGGGTGISEASAAASPANIRFVQVTIPAKSVSVFFATVAGLGSTVDLSRKAVAGQSVAINYYCGLEPLSVVQDDANNAPLNPEPGCASQTVFTPGCTYTIRLPSNGNNGNNDNNGNGNGNGNNDDEVSAGNYLILAIGGDRGGADVRERLALGGLECYTIGQCVETEPGISAGPVRQGINVRFDDYQGGGLSANSYPPDTNIKEGITYAQYTSGDAAHIVAPSNQGIPNRRIILVPIINKSQFDNGRDDVCMVTVGAFFLRNPIPGGNGGDIRAEYIGDRVTLGNGGFNPGGAAGNPQLTVAVLYK
ncbi:MAG: pilus assembly protein TadG-related protein [Acidobacteriota bacterium]|nr:pilus assembly protein TadG-related protein [Acidobacteriota bacterium]